MFQFKSVSWKDADREEVSMCIGHLRDLSAKGWEIKAMSSYLLANYSYTRVLLQRPDRSAPAPIPTSTSGASGAVTTVVQSGLGYTYPTRDRQGMQ